MPLKNYTTTINARKTASEISQMLAEHGAKAVMLDYDDDGEVSALSFKINVNGNDVGFRLPADDDAVYKILDEDSNVPNSKVNERQAKRVAWRIIKDWVDSQLALLETRMVDMEEVFLPYAVGENGKTLYESMRERNFQLPSDDGRDKLESVEAERVEDNQE